jgi:hypothetical protein
MKASIAPFLASLAADAVCGRVEAAELLDVDVDKLAGVLALVPARRLGGVHGAQPCSAQALEHSADRAGRHADAGGDLLARHPLAPQAFNTVDHRLSCRLTQPVGRELRSFRPSKPSCRKRTNH